MEEKTAELEKQVAELKGQLAKLQLKVTSLENSQECLRNAYNSLFAHIPDADQYITNNDQAWMFKYFSNTISFL